MNDEQSSDTEYISSSNSCIDELSKNVPRPKIWYQDPMFYISAFVSFPLIFIILLIVNHTAPVPWLVLDSESSNIGSAIGGIGAVVVGILNAIMLYLTFRRQSDSLELEKYKHDQEMIMLKKKMELEKDAFDKELKELQRKIEDEKKINQYRRLQENFDKICNSWTSKKIKLTGKKRSINNYILSDDINSTDSKIIAEEILGTFSRLNNIFEELSKLEKEYKNELMQEINSFYEVYMEPKYDIIINSQDEVIKEKLQKKKRKIDTYINDYRNNR
jgi:hypothetical protein